MLSLRLSCIYLVLNSNKRFLETIHNFTLHRINNTNRKIFLQFDRTVFTICYIVWSMSFYRLSLSRSWNTNKLT
jgi:hypothetical protein